MGSKVGTLRTRSKRTERKQNETLGATLVRQGPCHDQHDVFIVMARALMVSDTSVVHPAMAAALNKEHDRKLLHSHTTGG
jgi:hypothetical protein